MARNEWPTVEKRILSWALVLVVMAILSLGIGCWAADLNECVRVHPWWYCLRK